MAFQINAACEAELQRQLQDEVDATDDEGDLVFLAKMPHVPAPRLRLEDYIGPDAHLVVHAPNKPAAVLAVAQFLAGKKRTNAPDHDLPVSYGVMFQKYHWHSGNITDRADTWLNLLRIYPENEVRISALPGRLTKPAKTE